MENEAKIVTTNVAEDVVETMELNEGLKCKNFKAKGLVIGGVVLAASCIVVAKRIKLKDKIERMKLNKTVKKLEKKGYTVIEPIEELGINDEADEVNPEKE